MMPILLSLATCVSTFLGGLLALRYRDRLHLFMGFAAGMLVGIVVFELLPETYGRIRTLHLDGAVPMLFIMGGFLGFHVVEKLALIHGAHEEDYAQHGHPRVGLLSAAALSVHSFLDGVAIGVGFQAGNALGYTLAVTVIAHDFLDGLNTVTLVLANRNSPRRALALLVVDAVAPVLGALSTRYWTLSELGLTCALGLIAGLLLYIGASDILPEAHRRRSSVTIVMTILGAACAFAVTRIL